ncbi:type 2 isopentenyl-diphosphate Delta-isomerase [Paenibacillus cymbidii]|uniref:type 2 isopentenyl-diphosphate Delta-isomerase n=1 Tax=Paenibacillus cymbidii TaxID=1639034 RepID=UPI001080319F|nr:type 2 isopentenyl-diphosphate Delta-isomerase [Paenibacillus cymbidii]
MRISRKMDHVRHALAIGQTGDQGLSDIRFVPNSLPETAMDEVSLHTRIGELHLSSPIVINAMTGGSPETEPINRELAIAARERGLAMAVGSQMAALRDRTVAASYEIVRRMNPQGVLFANIGSEATVQQARDAVDMIGANGLQIHLNVMQELIMPEGDRDFRGMTERIGAIAAALDVPVIVKEVGFGLSMEAAVKLRGIGIRIVDVGGGGGTNFAAIENARRRAPMPWLNDWGHKTSIALLETAAVYPSGGAGFVIASGGISNALQIAKALALGASAVGIAGAFLRIQREQGTAALIAAIGALHDDLRLVMTALGAADIESIWRVPLVVTGETAHWCTQRGIDLAAYARRGSRLHEMP